MIDETYYDLLEVPADATLQQIERAYRIARQTYSAGSAATYSVFSDDESEEIATQVEVAYSVLSDARRRAEYDLQLGKSLGRPGMSDEVPVPASGGLAAGNATDDASRRPQGDLAIEFDRDRLEDVVGLDEVVQSADGRFDGPVLRRIRLSRGIELDEVSSVTKINETYLKYIEANRFSDLPAAVYTRGFLRQLAQILHLDPGAVAESYMEQYQQQVGRR
jgi:hypothetical protein